MATITITKGDVLPSTVGTRGTGTAGEALEAGQFIYIKSSDSKWYKADATTLEKSGNNSPQNLRFTLADAAAGQPIVFAEPGTLVTVGAVVAKGIWYVLSGTAGKMANHGDLTAGQYSVNVGYAPTTTTFFFNPQVSGVVI